jgi:hypothetical protein
VEGGAYFDKSATATPISVMLCSCGAIGSFGSSGRLGSGRRAPRLLDITSRSMKICAEP